MSNPAALVQKLWNYCNILRDDGPSYGDYVEQSTFLLFLKLVYGQVKPPFNKPALLIGEQTRIVAEVERRLSVVQELEAVASANLHRATRLRQSILQKAFTGKL